MQTVLISGGTGMVGQALTNLLLDKGYQVIVLSRNTKTSDRLHLSYAKWDVENDFIDAHAIKSADIIVHLAGESVATQRWTKKRKEAILQSRVKSGNLLVKALKENQHQVKTFISASAIGWYGPDTPASLQNGFVESNPADDSYLGNTCKLWEESIKPVESMGIRLVTLRIGIVLNANGGALIEFIKPAKFGLATILGSGNQMISWIHQTDLCKMIAYAAENEKVKGVYNAVSPLPVNNKTLVKAVAGKLNKFYLPIPVPAFMLHIILGEMSIEVLKSANVSSSKIQEEGFRFDFPNIDAALTNLLTK